MIGKDLSNPIPAWAEHGAERKVVPYTVATDMDSPNPDSGEEYFHTNTLLFNIIDDYNRFKITDAVTAPWNAPPPWATPAPAEVNDPNDLSPRQVVPVLQQIALHFFPLLRSDISSGR